jgi:hypothetical protein
VFSLLKMTNIVNVYEQVFAGSSETDHHQGNTGHQITGHSSGPFIRNECVNK